MIRYKDNSSLKLKTVTTIEGKTEYKKNCRRIKDKYYVKGEDCVQIGEKWFATSSKLIAFDYETKVWKILKGTPFVYGVVDFKSTGAAIFGYFTENKYNNVMVDIPSYGKVKCYHESILEKHHHIENISEGVWMPSRTLSPTTIERMKIVNSKRVYKEKGYNIEDNSDEFKDKIAAFDA